MGLYFDPITVVIRAIAASGVCGILLILAGCASGPPQAKPIGEAFVGPAQLKIRSDIPLESAAVTTLKHRERLEILQTRRQFLKVRTRDGKQGWTDEPALLAAADMKALRDLAEGSAKLPGQGVATTYQQLNVHTQPALSSPSFVQLKENDKFDVLQSVLLPRTE